MVEGPLRPSYVFTGEHTCMLSQNICDYSSMYMTLVTDVGTRHVDPHRHLDARLWSLGELKEAVLAVTHRLACWRLHQVWGNLQTDGLTQSAAHNTPRQVADQGECACQCLIASLCLFTAMQDPASLGNFRNCDGVSSQLHQGERPVYRVIIQKRHR